MTDAPHIDDLIAARLSRRGMLASLAALPLLDLSPAEAAAGRTARPLTFTSVPPTTADVVTVPEGYEARTLIAWGDPLFDNAAPLFDPDALTRAEQEQRFGQNNDMLALFPAEWRFPKRAGSRRSYLCVNHEYFDPALMFPAVSSPQGFTAEQIEAAYASMGIAVVTVEQSRDGAWSVLRDPAPGAGMNRRITPFTPVVFSGPAARHPWIVAAAEAFRAAEPGAPDGAIPCGTMANCAGGETPWGTYLSAEENFNFYFYNSAPAGEPPAALAADAASMGYPLTRAAASQAPAQFDCAKAPTGPTLYGWTVEVDPYDPSWAPRKRTALGRRKGECATTALTRDGRVAVYSGDDQVDEFVYKFLSAGRFKPRDRLANRDLLDQGQLHAARFEADGTGRWIPLTLEAANAAAAAAGQPGFADEGELMIRARQAARLLGATPMDRPEDVEAITDARWTGLGPVLVVCTKSNRQRADLPGNPRRLDPENPDALQPNQAGHIIRIDEAGADCAALTFRWDVFALAGDPAGPAIGANRAGDRLHQSVTVAGQPTFSGDRFACPDNVCFDSGRNVWISTDGSEEVFGDCNDGVYAAPVTRQAPRPVKRFLVAPVGAEVCGPMLSLDERTFFCAIQHPGESDRQGASFSRARWTGASPPSRFPDGDWPRSAVVYVRRKDGGVIGA